MAALAFVLRAAPLLLAQGPVLPASAASRWPRRSASAVTRRISSCRSACRRPAEREVAKLVRWGATLTADERPRLVGYLTRQFGLRPAVSHDAAAVAAGEAVFKEACRMCHDDDLSEQQRLSAAAWGREVDKMVRWGAKVSAEEKPALVAYLTSRWGA
jgi:cytochrome c5